MAVIKKNGFRAPYKSQTFRNQANALVQMNGLLRINSDITQLVNVITIPPYEFIQQGLIVEVTTPTSVSAPVMDDPYYLIVTAATPGEANDLAYSFAKTPDDVPATGVIIGVKENGSWILPPIISIAGILREFERATVSLGRVGPLAGLITTYDSPNYINSEGAAIDPGGRRVDFNEATFLEFPDPVSGFNRVDRIMIRRPRDFENRITERVYEMGGVFTGATVSLYDATSGVNNTLKAFKAKTLIRSDDSIVTLTLTQGASGGYELYQSILDDDRSTYVLVNAQVAGFLATEEHFSATIDASNSVHIVYVNDDELMYMKLDSAGAVDVTPLTLQNPSGGCKLPSVSVYGTDLYVAYSVSTAVNQWNIFFLKRTLTGSAVSGPTALTSNTVDLTEPDIFVSEDAWVHVVWRDASNSSITYRRFDDIGAPLAPAVTVSTNIEHIGVGTLNNGAKKPRVLVAKNREIYITFLQTKADTNVGLTVWSGGSGFMQQLLHATENFTCYDVCIEHMFNGLYLILSRSSSTDHVRLDSKVVTYTTQVIAGASRSVSTLRDMTGRMFHYVLLPHTYSGVATYEDEEVIATGPFTVVGSESTVQLKSNELLVAYGSFSGTPPEIGDRIVVTDGPNAGTFTLIGAELVSINGINDHWLVQLSASLTVGGTSTGDYLDSFDLQPNSATFASSEADVQAHAYSLAIRPSDYVLSRIVLPGPTILNYIFGGVGGEMSHFMAYGASVVLDWGATTPGNLTLGAGLHVLNMLENQDYTVQAGSFPMAEGDAIYIVVDGAAFNVTPQVTPIANLPYDLPILVFGAIMDGEFNPHFLGLSGVGQLDDGEIIVIGENLHTAVRERLGITSETTFEPYTSTDIISAGDTYPEALSKLDYEVNAIITSLPGEDYFEVGVGGEDTFVGTAETAPWSNDNTVVDLEVTVNGVKKVQSKTGMTADGEYRKTADNTIEFFFTIPEDSVVVIRRERMGGAGSDLDLTNIDVNPQPDVHATRALGATAKAWSAVYLKATDSAQVYRVEITGGVLVTTPVP